MNPASLTSLAFAGALALFGCAEQGMREKVEVAMPSGYGARHVQGSVPSQPDNFVRQQQCLSNAREAWATEANFRDRDVIYAADANAMQAAAEADQGEISPASRR